jgi:hypothetical protein
MLIRETRPLPSLEPAERGHFQGLFKAYSKGRGRIPPPWVVAKAFKDKNDKAVIAAVVAAHPVNGELWLIRGVLRHTEEGPPVLVRLSVEHFEDPGAEVTGKLLHLIPVAKVRDGALAWLSTKETSASALEAAGLGVSAAERRWARRVSAAAKKPLKRGREGYGDDHYRRIAQRTIELFDEGRRRDVVKALAAEEKRPEGTIRDWIRKARDLGFLEPASKQGRADFRPGPNYRRRRDG